MRRKEPNILLPTSNRMTKKYSFTKVIQNNSVHIFWSMVYLYPTQCAGPPKAYLRLTVAPWPPGQTQWRMMTAESGCSPPVIGVYFSPGPATINYRPLDRLDSTSHRAVPPMAHPAMASLFRHICHPGRPGGGWAPRPPELHWLASHPGGGR